EQVAAGDLDHYDALYVLETHVSQAASERILSWTKRGGLLWTCADSFLRDEYDAPRDFLDENFGLQRRFADKPAKRTVRPSDAVSSFVPVHGVEPAKPLGGLVWPGSEVLANYDEGLSAWLEKDYHDGRVVYLGHRAGLDYTRKAIRLGGMRTIWPDYPRAFLTRPLHQRKIVRELTVSEPIVLAHALSSKGGDVIVLANMRADDLENLEVRLRSPAKPVSVQTFDENGNLAEVPFTHADGVVLFTVPRLPSFLSGWNEIGQLYFVRSKPAPPDDRLDKLREQTQAELGSDDPETLAVAIWRAGFFPGWKLAGKLPPLLTHEDWRVRRATAESLGRLAPDGADSAIVAAFAKETDNHAKADQLHALARLGSDKFEAFHKLLTASPDPFLREEARLANAVLRPVITPNALPEEPYAKAIATRSPELLRKVFQDRAKLNPGQLTRLLAHLSAAYPVRFGNDVKAWSDYFSKLSN
ncbi:MAG: HEAT repeat domain-containing protein, partial [Opitutales bacterium]